jgi:hypothetical protein
VTVCEGDVSGPGKTHEVDRDDDTRLVVAHDTGKRAVLGRPA